MRRWGASAALLLLAALAPTQALEAGKKAEILKEIQAVLTQTAFVPGVDFEKWGQFVEARKDEIAATDDKRRFVALLNRTLREFGVSHISIFFARRKPAEGVPEARQGPMPGLPSHELEWMDDKTVRFRLRTFGDAYDRRAIEQALAEVAKAQVMILDLRGNGGGAVSNLQHFLSLLLPPRTEIGTMVSRRIALAFKEAAKGDPTNGLEIAKWTDRKFRTSRLPQEPFAGKIAVLTSRASASASEICAAALRELRSAPIVGAKTAGAVLVSRIVALPEGLEMKVPTADFYTAKYRRLEGNPLEPDAEENTRDTNACVKKALELLQMTR